MPSNTNYLEISIGDQQVQITDPEDLDFSIDYKLEDESDFQKKKGSEAIQIVIPATHMNAAIANSFQQVGVEDGTPSEVFKGFQTARVKHNGYELMLGKAVLTKATESDKPLDYTFDLYADNNDWGIALKEATLFDFIKHIEFAFTKSTIVNSWQFNGREEELPYVFAPIRYGGPMDESDYNMLPEYMKPCLSKYWILYWGFKSIGYYVQSDFFESEFFRRQVMPWTWGNFLFSDGTRLTNLSFKAKSLIDSHQEGDFDDAPWDLKVTNDSTEGMFDNNGVYNYNSVSKAMEWTYLNAYNYGNLDATFYINIGVNASASKNSDVGLKVRWFKNNVQFRETQLVALNAPTIGRRDFIGAAEDFATININPGDKVSCQVRLHIFDSGLGKGEIIAHVDEFHLEYFRVPLGGTINFENYPSFKNYKFLDFLRGIVDEFNLTIKTDTINKVIVMEPTHGYKLPGETIAREGFFNGDFIDWSGKQDISKISERILFSDFEREVIFKYKDDGNDGLINTLQDRNVNVVASAKYVFPDRFKDGKKEVENRFFSPVVHYTVDQWKDITGTAPQMIAMIPENISNTSKDESQNTFGPKSAYYKGIIPGIGWRFDSVDQHSFPFLFAVNYMPGGQNDPVLSYCDERIGQSSFTVAKGLFKRFYWQRMAIMRNGEWYNTWFKLNNYDVAGEIHRENKACRNQSWELMAIYNYSPMKDETTNVLLRRWVPISRNDSANTFPSETSVMNKPPVLAFDIKYAPLKALSSDIPK